jgi:hypothetical protein
MFIIMSEIILIHQELSMIKIVKYLFICISTIFFAGCADPYNTAVSDFKKSASGEKLFNCGGLKSTYTYRVIKDKLDDKPSEATKNLLILDVTVQKEFEDKTTKEMRVQYDANIENKRYEIRFVKVNGIDENISPELQWNFFCTEKSTELSNSSIEGLYEYAKKDKNSEMGGSIKVSKSGDNFTALVDVYFAEGNMPNICQFTGDLEKVRNNYILKTSDDPGISLMMNFKDSNLSVTLNGKPEICGQNAELAISGIYKRK